MATKPIIPWMGGKRRLAPLLLPMFPDHKCYVELFCGGAALFFLRPEPAKVEVINDINGELINLYRVVQHHLREFIRQFEWALNSRTMFKWLKNSHIEGLTDIQRAARFYYLQHHAFGAKVTGQNFGIDTTGRPINLYRIEEILSDAHFRMAGVYIEHLSWLECFNRYDKPHTLFYADPPYWKMAGYGNDFPLTEYEAMAYAMKNAKGKMIISINDHVDMRKVFDGLNIQETNITYTTNPTSRKESSELIIKNW